jgi:hypothetical protein
LKNYFEKNFEICAFLKAKNFPVNIKDFKEKCSTKYNNHDQKQKNKIKMFETLRLN